MADELFDARIRDCLRLGEKRPAFMGFLDLAERARAEDLLRAQPVPNCRFFGGFPEAERTVFGVFPEYLDADEEPFPVSALTVTFRKQDILRHGDFLGAFLAAGVVRASIGDILTEEGRAVLFARTEILDALLPIQKVGRVGVKVESGFSDPLPPAHRFQSLGGVIASPRLDCFVSFFASVSREKASSMVAAGLVSVNHRETFSGSRPLSEGDVVSIRHVGRFIVDTFGHKTKKGRLSIECRKFI